jgi:ubiquinone/menaquinone biosynthesis C-methylase UbiE
MSGAPYDEYAEWYDRYVRDEAIYRDVALPGMLALIGDIEGESVLDLACGQGWLARELATQRGARVTGVDLSAELLTLARRYEAEEPLGVTYIQDDAQTLSRIESDAYDGVVCTLALMDIPDLTATLRAARRILRQGGWFVFSLTHPCFQSPYARTTEENGDPVRVIRRYLTEGFWRSEADGVRARLGSHHRTLSTYLNALMTSGFALERLSEPPATGGRLAETPVDGEIPALLLVRARAV